MKSTILLFLICGVFTVSAQKTLEFNYSLRTESKPYMPITGIKLNDQPVMIGIVGLKYGELSINYWKSVEAFDVSGSGNYDALISVFNPKIVYVTWFNRVILFNTLRKENLTIITTGLTGGKDFKWSVLLTDQIFNFRSPRWIMHPSVTFKGFTWNNWIHYEFEKLSYATGLSWKSKKVNIGKFDLQTEVVWNESITDLLVEDRFGQRNVFLINLHFFPIK